MNAQLSSPLKALLLLGGSSVVSMAIGVVANKAYAVYVGPEGVGFWGLLQSVFNFSLIGFGLGISTNLVRLASAADSGLSLTAYRRAAWELYLVLVGALLIAFAVAREPIAQRFLSGASPEASLLLAGAVAMGFAMAIQISILNVLRQIRLIATINVFTSLAGATAGIVLVINLGEQGLPVALFIGQTFGFFIASFQVHQHFPRNLPAPNPLDTRTGRIELLRRGIPFTLSTLVGGGVQTILPLLVLYHLTKADVGYYRAVIAIGTIYLGFVQGSLAQDYYPRLASSAKEEVFGIFRQQSRLVLGLIIPGILVIQGFGIYALSLLFTPQFLPAIEILRWQLIGDVIKVLSFLMGFMVLARLSIKSYATAEVLAGLVLLTSFWFGTLWFGLSGIGASNLVAYGVYLGVLIILLHDWLPTYWFTQDLPIWLGAALLVALVGSTPGLWQPVIGLLVAGLWATGFYFARLRQPRHG